MLAELGVENIKELVEWVDYPALKVLMLAIGTFISEDLTCVLAGILAVQGKMTFPLAVTGCVLGIWGGDMAIYWIARVAVISTSGGNVEDLGWFRRWASRRVTPEKIAKGRRFFDRYGVLWIFFSRFIPGSRVVSYLAAGASGWSFGKFSLTLLLAALVWVPVLCGLAYMAGDAVLGWLPDYLDYAWVGLLGVVVFLWIFLKLILPMFSWYGRRRLYGKWQRLTRWEYWPMWMVYPPVVVYLIYLGFRNRKMCLFTSSNPAIESSGFAYDSKGEILDLLSTDRVQAEKIADYLRIPFVMGEKESTLDLLESWMEENGLDYPVVLKPDEGERGQGVAIIKSRDQAEEYLLECEEEIIGQKFIIGPEYGVYYLRYPDEEKGKIISLSEKHQQFVQGDGETRLEDLILSDDRGSAMFSYYKEKFSERLNEIPEQGKRITLAEIGTHSRGAMFTDDRHLVTEDMEHSIDELSQSFEGFHIGRYDIRVDSLETFQQGKGIHVLELNGVTGEPAHIYHPGSSIFKAWAAMFHQWKAAVKCGKQNLARGHRPMSIGELVSLIRKHGKKDRF